jgi:hypothetical protein
MRFWRARFLNSMVAVVAALAWFTSTHHCLLRVLTATQGTAASACHCSEHCHGAGAQQNGQSTMLACCQGLLSPALELAQSKVKFTAVLLGYQLAFLDQIVDFAASQTGSICTEYDTGPPPKDCFVQTVLRRSLRENAPPSLI